jgi:hypothetical protein
MPTNDSKNITNQYLNGVNSIFQGATRWVPRKVGGVTWTHLNPKTFLARTFLDIAFLDMTVNTPVYMVLLIILRSRHQAIYI